MSDRLQGWRAQRQGTQGGAHDSPHELASFPPSNDAPPPATEGGDLGEITSISEQVTAYREIAVQINTAHARSLERTDDDAIQQDNAQLAELTGRASDLQAQIRRRIQALHARARNGELSKSTIQHSNRVQEKFKAAIQDFQLSERDFRAKYTERVERQFKIVKSDATPDEVRAVVEDPNAGGQIFRNALAQSDRYGQARQAYKEAQDRHVEIQRLETTITQLGQLFNEMAILIEEQQDTIDHAALQAEATHRDLERGGQKVDEATELARSARRKRWWCFFLSLLIIAVLAIAIAVPIATKG